MASSPHSHAAHPSPQAPARRSGQRRALWWALVINAAFVAIELVGAVGFHSLALFGDSAHQATDVVAVALAIGALRLVERPGSARLTFGLQRAEVLAALANGVVLVAAAGWILVEGAHRLAHPTSVRGGGVLLVAGVGLVANGAGAVLVGRSEGHSLGIRAVTTHLASDAFALLATMVAALLVLIGGVNRADPAASLLIGVLVVVASWRLVGRTLHVLLEGTPHGMDLPTVEAAILGDEAVAGVHHVHLWSLASDVPALSAHVVLTDETSLHEAQGKADRLKGMLGERFGIEHVTLELECHGCDVPDDTGRIPSWR